MNYEYFEIDRGLEIGFIGMRCLRHDRNCLNYDSFDLCDFDDIRRITELRFIGFKHYRIGESDEISLINDE